MLALIAFEPFCDPEQRAEDNGAIIAGQVRYTRLDDEATQFDQVPRALAALDLPAFSAPSKSRGLRMCVRSLSKRGVL